MDLSTTAGKNVVCVTFAVKDEKENSIAVVLDQSGGWAILPNVDNLVVRNKSNLMPSWEDIIKLTRFTP